MRAAFLFALALVMIAPASAQNSDVTAEDRLFHEELLVLDTHLDTPERFDVAGWEFGERHLYAHDNSQVDLPRMEAGGLDGGFFVIYTQQGALTPAGYAVARDAALGRAMAIHRMLGAQRDRVALVTDADQAERARQRGRRLAFISVENSWPLGEDLTLLRTFHDLGVRMAGPVHFRTNQFADSATGETRFRGLSTLVRQWVAEMNRLGMIIDVSHSSDAAFDQMLQLSLAPVIASHSGPRAIFAHPRNLDDGRMRALARAGGVMFVNSVYLVQHDNSDERDALTERQRHWGDLDPAQRRQLLADLAAHNRVRPYTNATFEDFMRSLLYAVRLMGPDHVGLGADWDGGGGVIGMEDVSQLPRITARLRREGIPDADIAKIMGGNLMRVLRQVQVAADRG